MIAAYRLDGSTQHKDKISRRSNIGLFEFKFWPFTNYTRSKVIQCHVCEVHFQQQAAPFRLAISGFKSKITNGKLMTTTSI